MDGLVAIVTGAASGIGLATARLMAARGAVVVAADIDPADDSSLHGTRCDVTDDASVSAAVEQVIDRFGRIDIVVNNAGIGAQGTIGDNDDQEWTRVFDVNVFGTMRMARAALPHLRRSPQAAIVNTGSVAAAVGIPDRALYSATKGAVHAMTLAMAADHLADGIRVNAVAPGTADNPWIGRLLERADDPAAERAVAADLHQQAMETNVVFGDVLEHLVGGSGTVGDRGQHGQLVDQLGALIVVDALAARRAAQGSSSTRSSNRSAICWSVNRGVTV